MRLDGYCEASYDLFAEVRWNLNPKDMLCSCAIRILPCLLHA
jgi:hypothetical protein